MKFGYARVSTKSQKHDLQVDAFLKEGIDTKNIYADISSGAKSDRKGLDEMLSKLREGDTVVVWKMDRIARSLSHLVKLIEDFEKRGVHFKSIQETLSILLPPMAVSCSIFLLPSHSWNVISSSKGLGPDSKVPGEEGYGWAVSPD